MHLAEQAAAYLLHLVKNHPFVDGNKRVGLACCLAFLRLNGIRIVASDDDLVNLVTGVAGGRCSKADIAVFLRARTKPPSRRATLAQVPQFDQVTPGLSGT